VKTTPAVQRVDEDSLTQRWVVKCQAADSVMVDVAAAEVDSQLVPKEVMYRQV
jgi:hypothetical protein